MNISRPSFTRQYEHIGNIRHGVQTGPWRVEFDAPVEKDAGGAYTKINQGSVVSLNAAGKFVPGCAAGSTANHPVPFIAMKNVADPDVTAGITGKTQAVSTYSAVGDIITAIPCTSGYEIETTEFVGTTFAPNDAITAATGNDLGKVKVATQAPYGDEPYLGFVSIPPKKDYLENQRLAFFACFIPADGDASN